LVGESGIVKYPLSNKKRIDTLLGGGMLQKSGGHIKLK
jgi:hypothetical protein